MGFLERAIRRNVSEAVGKAVGNAVQQAVEPKATELANKAASSIDQATGNAENTVRQAGGFDSAMSNLQRSVEGYATEAAKNMKICPMCNEPSTADKKFCPKCGGKLPDTTVAQGAVCTNCGKQNTIGTKFCSECGTKLPAAIQEEQEAANRNASVMAEWDIKLSAYPKWNCGGKEYNIEEYDSGVFCFSAEFDGGYNAAKQAVEAYRQLLLQNGFRMAGQYPSMEHLYKMENGNCYHVDTEHCFTGDNNRPNIGFNIGEPCGGFNYVKPEPKKKSFRDLFNF